MKSMVIGFSKPKNRRFPIMSYLIKWYLKTPYSHVYIKFNSSSLNRWLVYEAVGGGVRFVGLNLWSEKAEEIKEFTIQISDEQYVKVMQYCVDHAGYKYGTMQNVGIFLADALKLKDNPFKSGKVCSEVIGEILQDNGYPIAKKPDLVTPKDIYTALDK